ncbi:helix-turn-helix domain-containing protein [Nocardia wallacei]|uniref:helix-turn-helix domain-containing protein n=1 Tax=Nocardia wallacei TaxID=480035 RepID=UPI0024545680|nr:helix-turn-helix domain-containing protein [Nocardia wallacei]
MSAIEAPETRTLPLEEVADRLGAPSVDWLARQLRAGKIPGRKVGRSWRMTESDVARAIELLAVGPRPTHAPASVSHTPTADPSGLTAGSRKRLERRRSH